MSGENKGQFPITDAGIRGGTPSNYGQVDDVKKMLLATNPTRVTQAGQTYKSVAKMLSDSMTTLWQQAGDLAKVWSGSDSSVQAQKSLQLLHQQSSELFVKNSNLGNAFTQAGTDYLQWYQDHIPGTGFIHTDGDDEYAQNFVQRLNTRYQQIFDTLPPVVDKDLPNVPPPTDRGQYNPVSPIGPGGGNLPGSGTSSNGSFGPPSGDPNGPPEIGGVPPGSGIPPSTDPGGPGGPDFPGPTLPGGPNGPGGPGDPGGLGDLDDGSTSLAGFDPVGTGPGGLGGTGFGGLGSGGLGPGGGYGSGGGIGSGFGSGSGGFGPGAGGLGASEAGAGGIGAGGVPGGGMGGRGMAGTGAGAGGRGMAGAGGRPMGMMPHGAGGAEGEQERERTSWLTEDEDVWGADGDAAPPVIGG